MQLIGYMDSPFVRRVAITMQFLGIEYTNRALSIFRDYDEFRAINPMVKVPTLVLDNGQMLTDSTLIIDYLESQLAGRRLMPVDKEDYRAALQFTGAALLAMEKVAQLIYETSHHPADMQYGSWINRLEQQLEGAAGLMETATATCSQSSNLWLFGNKPTHADILIAVAWRFMQHIDRVKIEAKDYPGLAAFSACSEALPEFLACPLSE